MKQPGCCGNGVRLSLRSQDRRAKVWDKVERGGGTEPGSSPLASMPIVTVCTPKPARGAVVHVLCLDPPPRALLAAARARMNAIALHFGLRRRHRHRLGHGSVPNWPPHLETWPEREPSEPRNAHDPSRNDLGLVSTAFSATSGRGCASPITRVISVPRSRSRPSHIQKTPGFPAAWRTRGTSPAAREIGRQGRTASGCSPTCTAPGTGGSAAH